MDEKLNSSNKPIIVRRFIVSGKVQGVFFRTSTREQALSRNLSGYAKNLHSGQVEVLAQGDPELIEELFQWLHLGPKLARVDSVIEVGAGCELELEGFKIF
ncbi:MAG: acylphosphatase [Gammaproteobacteria bacterium]|nr:acylphosphatase [Gammaproteobacteria bacterium]NNC96740.1 acylphosphatase [Gammaproteobacteria bacterium]NNM13978.1 acylphosphatase [Gammaproteobacteria bacterium]